MINLKHTCIEIDKKKYSYEEFNNILGNTIDFLKRNGFDENSKIPICCYDSFKLISLTLATISMNACAVLIESNKKETEIIQILESINASKIVTDREQFQCLEKVIYIPERCKSKTYEECKYPSFKIEDRYRDAVIIFTSGSSGVPKGIIRTQETVRAHLETMIETLKIVPDDKVLHLAPLYHAYGFEHIMAGIYGGANNQLYNTFDYRTILSNMKEKATVVVGVPYQYALFTKIQGKHFPLRLRLLLSASAPLRASTFEKIRENWGLGIVQLYGSSELSASLLNLEVKNKNSVGKPIKGVNIKINEESELLVKSPYICKSYIGDKYKLPIENGWYHTGDIARFDQYQGIVIEGRIDNIINVSGKKVCPEEVEAVLTSMPAIKEAYVYGKCHDTYGNIIAAKVYCAITTEVKEIKKYCSKYLPDYKIPLEIEKVTSIPHTGNGKIKREKEIFK